MRKLSRFEKLGVVAAVIIACGFLYMKRVYEPQEKKLKATVAQLNKVIAEVNGLKSVPSAVSLRKSLQKHKQELEEINKSLAGTAAGSGTDKGLSALISRVSGRIDECGLKVQSFAPKGSKKDELFSWRLFELTMTGGYFNYLSFLERLRAMPEAVKIEKVTMEQLDDSNLRITMEIFL